MEKAAIAMINHKGGVGKTTLGYILSQIALSRGLCVSVVDLDPQRNLSDALFLVQRSNQDKAEVFANLNITNELTDKGDLIIIDCPPALNKLTRSAMDFADIALVPVKPDLFSVANLELVYELGEQCEKNNEQLALIKVGFDKRGIVDTVAKNIKNRQFRVAGDVPINRLIPYNILHGRLWQYGISAAVRAPFFQLLDRTYNAYVQMLDGNFENAWE